MVGRATSAIATLIMAGSLPTAASAFDLLEAFALAQQNDPTFREATFEKFAQDETLRIAWSKLLPTMSGHFTYRETQQDVRSSDNTVFSVGSTSFPTTEYGARLSQPIIRMTEMTRVYQAKSETRKAAAEVDAAYQELVFRVADTYFGVLGAQDELALRERERIALARQRDLAQKRLDAGLGIAPDVYEAEAREVLAEADEQVARFKLEDAIQALAEVTGVLEDELEPLSGEMPLASPQPGNPDLWVRNAMDSNPSLEAARQGYEIAEREVNRQRSGHVPTIDFEASYNARDTGGSLFGGGSNVDTGDVAVKVNVPLFSGGGVLFATRRAIDLRKKERQALVRVQRRTERETRSSFQAVVSSERRVRALRESVEAQRVAVTSREKAVKAGLDVTINVLNAERELYASLRDYAEARYNYVRSVLRLEQSAGALGAEDLEEVNKWLKSPSP